MKREAKDLEAAGGEIARLQKIIEGLTDRVAAQSELLSKRAEGASGDAVNHPPHYGGEGNVYEAIKVIEAWGLGFCLGNAVKYVCRAGKKGHAVEDLKKARWYLDRELERLEAEANG